MANRVILGKYTNAPVTGGTNASPLSKFGLYISKHTVDITSATVDQLIFNTDTGISVSRIFGMFQLANATSTQGTATASTTITAGSTATVSVPTNDFNFNFGFTGFGLFAPVISGSFSSGSGDFGDNFGQLLNYTSNADGTISIGNTGTTTTTVPLVILPVFENVSFF